MIIVKRVSSGYARSWKNISNSSGERFNPFLINVPILHPPENTRKPKVFWCFQGGVEWEHWSDDGLRETHSAQLRQHFSSGLLELNIFSTDEFHVYISRFHFECICVYVCGRTERYAAFFPSRRKGGRSPHGHFYGGGSFSSRRKFSRRQLSWGQFYWWQFFSNKGLTKTHKK